MSNSIYTPSSDKKFGEKDSVANCQPTILQIVGKWYWWPSCTTTFLQFGFLYIREVSLYPSWPPPILQKNRTNKRRGFGDLSGVRKKSKNWVSIKYYEGKLYRKDKRKKEKAKHLPCFKPLNFRLVGQSSNHDAITNAHRIVASLSALSQPIS